MIKNYIKIAWRNLIKNKAHTLINIAGLSVGLVCSLMILLWVQSELSVDAFHKNKANLYQVYELQHLDGKINAQYYTPGILASELKRVIPEVQYAAATDFNESNTFKYSDKILKLTGASAEPDFFKMFSFKLLQGNAETTLKDLSGIAISQKMAIAFFGGVTQAMGKSLRMDDKRDFTVTSVFEDPGANSSLKFDYVLNWQEFVLENPWVKKWGNNSPYTYIQLQDGANVAAVQHKIFDFVTVRDPFEKKGVFTQDLAMQPFDETYLHNHFTDGKIDGGRIGYVRLFSIVAVFILLIACINFMNLTTARSVKRAKEIGVRKVVGAMRSVLIKQFLIESLLLTGIAVSISLFLLVLLLPYFNHITQKEIELPFNQPLFWIRLSLITLITGIISGSYPAIFLSSFNPIKVLKGTLKLDSGNTLFRKGLVVFQFSLSIILIIGTIIVSRQVNYIQSVNLGFDRENLVYIPVEGNLKDNHNYDVFKNEALSSPGIAVVSRSSSKPTRITQSTISVKWPTKAPNLNLSFNVDAVGYDFAKALKLQLIAGRDFSKEFATDSSGYIINETAAARLGYTDAIGQPLTLWTTPGKIIGVVKDFHFASLHDKINPLILYLGERNDQGWVMVRTKAGKTKEALASLEKISKTLNPNFQFTYYFSDDEYNKLYKNEQVISKLSDAFAFLAIFISCLGLLGLATFTAEQRLKEIGIRKVLGASVGSLFGLLSAEFMWLIIIALLIATPTAIYFMNYWLRTFQYSTPMEWWMFVLSGGLVIVIALLTVSIQAMKAALVNPIKSLKAE